MKTTNPKKSATQELLHQAGVFADASVRGVLEGLREDPGRPNRLFRDYARLVLELEVHFLFPNLPIGDRRLLVALLRTRNGLALRRLTRGRGRRGVTVGARAKRWRELRERARRLARDPALTAAQKAVLEASFLGNAALNCRLEEVSQSR